MPRVIVKTLQLRKSRINLTFAASTRRNSRRHEFHQRVTKIYAKTTLCRRPTVELAGRQSGEELFPSTNQIVPSAPSILTAVFLSRSHPPRSPGCFSHPRRLRRGVALSPPELVAFSSPDAAQELFVIVAPTSLIMQLFIFTGVFNKRRPRD